MSNLMPGDNSGAEPREHHPNCATLCEFADTPVPDGDECPEGHGVHDCNCDALEEDWYISQAEAWADYTEAGGY